jgi:putative FmdB family regulatory protein
MPLYEYECDNGHRFEKIQKFSDPLVSVCPTCGSPVHKLMSSPAIQFKGSGWYITDYAKKESTKAGKAGGSTNDGSGDKSADKSGEKSGDAKSDASKSETTKTDSSSPASSPPASTSSDSKKD